MSDIDQFQFSNHLRFASLSHNPGPISHFGTRYDTSGRFLAERGNTVVCHLAEGSEPSVSINDARARITRMDGCDRLDLRRLHAWT